MIILLMSLLHCIEVDAQVTVGMVIESTLQEGIAINQTGKSGITIGQPADHGLYVDDAQKDGIHINDAAGFGIFARGATAAAYLEGSVGVGTMTPRQQIHSHLNTTNTSNFLRITNQSSGSGSGDGLDIGIEGTGDAILWMKENQDLKFATNNSTRMTILNDGNVGIGTLSPINDLELVGAENNGVAGFTRSDLGGDKSHILHGPLGDWYIRPSLTTGRIIIADNGGNVGIGTSDPSAKLHIEGSIKWSPITSFISIDASEFQAGNSAFAYEYINGGLDLRPGAVSFFFLAPVSLPHEATIVEASLVYRDNHASSDLTFSLYRRALTGTECLPELLSSATPVINSNDCQISQFTPTSNLTIDNESYSYFIQIDVPISGGGFGSMRVRAARIEYTIEQPY